MLLEGAADWGRGADNPGTNEAFMILLDTALKRCRENNTPVCMGVIGAGYMGRGMVLQTELSNMGMRVGAVFNRHIDKAAKAYTQAGIHDFILVNTLPELEEALAQNRYAITDNALLLCQAQGIAAVVEATGDIDFGALISLTAMEHGKHVVLMNAELDATLGPILKVYADKAKVILSDADGDQPGLLMNLIRYVQTIGFEPVLAGNVKGLQDRYRTPATQKEYAQQYKQKPHMVTSFADGSKISFEMAVVANATGFKVGQRGMYGPRCRHVTEAVDLFPREQMLQGGLVDYVLGAEPPGVFVIGYNDHPVQREHMLYYKMGPGPLYVFYTPYHLPTIEAPLTAARAVLFHDPAITPRGAPVCTVITMAKRDLQAGDVLDGIGGFDAYGVLENFDEVMSHNALPMGLCAGCQLQRDICKDAPIAWSDVHIPKDRIGDRLWQEQIRFFASKV